MGSETSVTLPLALSPAAEDDLLDATLWYDAQQPGLGDSFLRSVEAGTARIRRHPKAYPASEDGIHSALLQRFPYALLFRIQEKRIEIVAVWHSHREPEGRLARTSGSVTLPSKSGPREARPSSSGGAPLPGGQREAGVREATKAFVAGDLETGGATKRGNLRAVTEEPTPSGHHTVMPRRPKGARGGGRTGAGRPKVQMSGFLSSRNVRFLV